jgi:hypothetical protein
VTPAGCAAPPGCGDDDHAITPNEQKRFDFARNLIIEAGDLARGLRTWRISIAYVQANNVLIGMVNNPAAGELFTGGSGRADELKRLRVFDQLVVVIGEPSEPVAGGSLYSSQSVMKRGLAWMCMAS